MTFFEITDIVLFIYLIFSLFKFYKYMNLARKEKNKDLKSKYETRYHLLAVFDVALVLSYLALRSGVKWLNLVG